MIATPYQVKRYRGDYDGILEVDPGVLDDVDHGYYVGFRGLQTDGVSWVCTDATAGAAVWEVDPLKDYDIDAGLQAVSGLVARYCNNMFIQPDPDFYEMASATYAGKTITDITAAFDTMFYAGDSLLIMGSGRNDGYYRPDVIAETVITMSLDFGTPMMDTRPQVIVNVSWPKGLREIGARMVEYDVYRRNISAGLAQESIGSYSASKERTDLFGTAYPNSVIAGISAYKRPRVVDGLGQRFLGYKL